MSQLAPVTEYAKVGKDRIAYQVIGDGPIDLVYTVGWFNSLDAFWEYPDSAHFLRRLAGFSRLIGFDPRGSGASDPLSSIESFDWETRVEDMIAVLDAVGSQRAAVFAFVDACPAAMLLAATQPERVSALILANPVARFAQADDYPIGMTADAVRGLISGMRALWGTEGLAPYVYPSRAEDPRFLQWFARYQRAVASPRTIAELYSRTVQLDVRHALPLIHMPTLILGTGYELTADLLRYTAERIEGARVVWLPTMDATPVFTHTEEVSDLVEEFITGVRRVADPERRLATVLFTDIVGSTDRASALGDARWRRLLDEHDEVVRDGVTRLGGKLVKTTGDGALATFEGPARCIRATMALREALRAIDIDIRAGLHAGEVELRGDDVGGIAVHIAARVMAEAEPGEILASSTVKDLVVGSGMAFSDRGTRVLKGIPDEWRLYAVESA